VWLRRAPRRNATPKHSPSPRDIRWWVGIAWFVISAMLLGLVAHVTMVGSLQHLRSQNLLYEQLRADLAEAIAPLGQLDVDGELVASGTPIAVLSIDRLGVAEVVVQGTSASDLMDGPGHRRDTVFPGQAGTSIIMGRQLTFGGPFSGLAKLVPGDSIEIITGQGTSTYEVLGIRRDGDLLPDALGDGEGRLELITADGVPLAPSGALYIDAALVSEVQETPSPVFTEQVLDPSELAMASDPQAWWALLIWIPWLAAAAAALRWARTKWGPWQTWMVGVPILLVLGAAAADAAIATLPNLL
jgi:hypothetical protein